LTRQINAWEGRWPLNTYRNRDRSKLSQSALDRLATAEAMTLADYGDAIARRQRNREVYARFTGRYDAAITLAARGAAPLGSIRPSIRSSTCPPRCSAFRPCRCAAGGLPLGLQLMGFAGRDASLFAVATAVRDLFGLMPSPASAA
jgi:Asp-tRNA(Asn)/Glu-tRNA(Gln) amidotransferase A subunit family amidase